MAFDEKEFGFSKGELVEHFRRCRTSSGTQRANEALLAIAEIIKAHNMGRLADALEHASDRLADALENQGKVKKGPGVKTLP